MMHIWCSCSKHLSPSCIPIITSQTWDSLNSLLLPYTYVYLSGLLHFYLGNSIFFTTYLCEIITMMLSRTLLQYYSLSHISYLSTLLPHMIHTHMHTHTHAHTNKRSHTTLVYHDKLMWTVLSSWTMCAIIVSYYYSIIITNRYI